MKRILMIVGSMRKESFNKKLALLAKELISDRAEVSFLEYKDIPSYESGYRVSSS